MSKKRNSNNTSVPSTDAVNDEINEEEEMDQNEVTPEVTSDTEVPELDKVVEGEEDQVPETDDSDDTEKPEEGNTPEVTPEPTSEEKPKVNENEFPEVESWEDVKKVVTAKASVGDKIEHLVSCGFKPVELFVAFYVDYGNTMTPSVVPSVGAQINTRLFNNLITTIREKDDQVFKAKFDIINLIFKNGAKDAEGNWGPFFEARLTRFTDLQKLSAVQINTSTILTTLISSLADAGTRDVNKKSLVGFSNEYTTLSDEDVSRLRRYYNL